MWELTKDELLDLIFAYNRYIQEANEENKYAEGWFPVCISEFLDNDYEFYKI